MNGTQIVEVFTEARAYEEQANELLTRVHAMWYDVLYAMVTGIVAAANEDAGLKLQDMFSGDPKKVKALHKRVCDALGIDVSSTSQIVRTNMRYLVKRATLAAYGAIVSSAVLKRTSKGLEPKLSVLVQKGVVASGWRKD